MAAPSPYERALFDPVLQIIGSASGPLELAEIADAVSGFYDREVGSLDEKLPSGRETVFENRLAWTLSHLFESGLIVRAGEQVYTISEVGRSFLRSGESLEGQQLSGFAEPDNEPLLAPGANEDIVAEINTIYEKHTARLKADLLARIHARDPAFF